MGVLEIAKGMGTTLGKLFQKPLTVSYPESPIRLQPRFLGQDMPTTKTRLQTNWAFRI